MAEFTRSLRSRRAAARSLSAALVLCAVVAAACAGSDLPSSSDDGAPPAWQPDGQTSTDSEGKVDAAPSADGGGVDVDDFDVVVHDDELGAIAPELLGTNVPSWLGPLKLSDPAFLQAIDDLGVNLIRMPGGSWSNTYDWAGCELRDERLCYFIGSARPSDFAALLVTTGVAGMWTLNPNDPAESAAALVAFFNGDVDDDRAIGIDRNGKDWKTVGHWAGLRADGGHSEPIGIHWWEFGNEVYGGRPDAGGSACASFGWEYVWTCDGSEYVLGDGEHDGYLDVRAAMLEVDRSIEVGAVGVAPTGGWGGWGDDLIAAAGDELDYYVVHTYGYDTSPDPEEAVLKPVDLWRPMVEQVDDVLDDDVPIAITEYNLISGGYGDTDLLMIRAVNALYLADSIGQMALAGVDVAAQWALAGGIHQSGTDYGLIEADGFARRPQYAAMRAWGAAGSTMMSSTGRVRDVRVYPTRGADGSLHIVVVHIGGEERRLSLGFDTPSGELAGTLTTAWADDLEATEMTTELAVTLDEVDGGLSAVLPPYSISVLDVTGV